MPYSSGGATYLIPIDQESGAVAPDTTRKRHGRQLGIGEETLRAGPFRFGRIEPELAELELIEQAGQIL